MRCFPVANYIYFVLCLTRFSIFNKRTKKQPELAIKTVKSSTFLFLDIDIAFLCTLEAKNMIQA